ncbi:MAG: lipid-A-disaccharide synthase-related protein [Thermostichales cyanobacterium GMQP_bins_62]
MARIICLSNGHGEDQVGCQIAQALQSLSHQLLALPLVGLGYAYRQQGIPILGQPRQLPSGGFDLLGDLRQGLLGILNHHWHNLRHSQADLILAVGDVLVLAMAWASGIPYVFVGTAKSDYFWGEVHRPYFWRRCDYFPWERWLMRRALAVYPRDGWTTQNLRWFGIPAYDLGNPMVDDLSQPQALPLPKPALLLLPGSRVPEAYRNWQQLLGVVGQLPPELTVMVALAAGVDPKLCQGIEPMSLVPFAAGVHHADVVLAMAGTATEQCVALGKPVVTIPGRGPQFTRRFARRQAKLLGPAVHLCQPATAPQVIRQILQRLAKDPHWQLALQAEGRKRLGDPGAAGRIARHVDQLLKNVTSC